MNILTGRATPSGKLVQSWPRNVGQVHGGATPWLQRVRPAVQHDALLPAVSLSHPLRARCVGSTALCWRAGSRVATNDAQEESARREDRAARLFMCCFVVSDLLLCCCVVLCRAVLCCVFRRCAASGSPTTGGAPTPTAAATTLTSARPSSPPRSSTSDTASRAPPSPAPRAGFSPSHQKWAEPTHSFLREESSFASAESTPTRFLIVHVSTEFLLTPMDSRSRTRVKETDKTTQRSGSD